MVSQDGINYLDLGSVHSYEDFLRAYNDALDNGDNHLIVATGFPGSSGGLETQIPLNLGPDSIWRQIIDLREAMNNNRHYEARK